MLFWFSQKECWIEIKSILFWEEAGWNNILLNILDTICIGLIHNVILIYFDWMYSYEYVFHSLFIFLILMLWGCIFLTHPPSVVIFFTNLVSEDRISKFQTGLNKLYFLNWISICVVSLTNKVFVVHVRLNPNSSDRKSVV